MTGGWGRLLACQPFTSSTPVTAKTKNHHLILIFHSIYVHCARAWVFFSVRACVCCSGHQHRTDDGSDCCRPKCRVWAIELSSADIRAHTDCANTNCDDTRERIKSFRAVGVWTKITNREPRPPPEPIAASEQTDKRCPSLSLSRARIMNSVHMLRIRRRVRMSFGDKMVCN